jgi:hypothetical protein
MKERQERRRGGWVVLAPLYLSVIIYYLIISPRILVSPIPTTYSAPLLSYYKQA